MIVKSIRLRNIRCHPELDVELGDRITVLVGVNGAGKTSVLEAIHLVLVGGSPRTAQPRELISWGQETSRVELDLEDPEGRPTTAAAGHSASGDRRLTVDGAPLPNHSRWEESLPVRMFLPDDVRLIRGSPRRRRRFLDRMAIAADPSFAAELAAYDEALSQRNALLRRGVLGEDHSAWESLLAAKGLKIVLARAGVLRNVVGPYVRLHGVLAPGGPDSTEVGVLPEKPGLVYRTNAADLDEESYRRRLAEQREADRRRTFTDLGPHRDDLRFTAGGRDLRSFGSQGEQRTAHLALLLAERSWAAERSGRAPLLLLDDVMSELDEARRRALLSLLRGGQTVITTTDLHYFTPEELQGMTVVQIERGRRSPGRPARTEG